MDIQLSAPPLQVSYPENTIGALMESPAAVFPPDLTVKATTEAVREIVKRRFVTYAYVVDLNNRLLGVVAMRDLLLARPDQPISEVMLKDFFAFQPEMPLVDAMKLTLDKHYPSYPVTDANGILLGLLWGQRLFKAQSVELVAQAGSMVGVDKEERTTTRWQRSFRLRHPWLLLNLVTAAIAASVVGAFQDSIDKLVVLAVFLPLIAGQSGNTGCQSLAVALRGMTLGELKPGRERTLLFKEMLLGALNGFVVGALAGAGMFAYARLQGGPESPWVLGGTVWMAMTIACTFSSVAGVVVPLVLRKFGADPATASSIFLTTANDLVSMGCFLGLATLWVL